MHISLSGRIYVSAPKAMGGCGSIWLGCYVVWHASHRRGDCSKWPSCAWTNAVSLLQRWSIASSATLCWNHPAHVPTSPRRNSSGALRTGTWYTGFRITPPPDAAIHWILQYCHEHDVEMCWCTVLPEEEYVSPAMMHIAGSNSSISNTSLYYCPWF